MILDARQSRERDAVGEGVAELQRHLLGQPRLSDPPGAGDGHQPALGILQTLSQAVELRITAHKRRGRRGRRDSSP